MGAHEIGVAAVQRHFDIDGAPVGVPAGDADARP